jgi:putative lipoic acid-binding regulatory protein
VKDFLDGRKPEIDYPCTWSYRILGTDEPRMRIAVFEIVGGFEHQVTLGLESSQGKYRSLQLELIVRDEAQRLSIFEALKRHPDVRFVL